MYAILLFNDEFDLKAGVDDLFQLFACNPVTGDLLVFESMDEADKFREKNTIDSQIIELPVYQTQQV